ncbi:hypothetical protein BTVI_141619 [Pitangus sulphuratus]|nr:hypothetical protein BTVI_141619 [Pitangus sulphuratus]
MLSHQLGSLWEDAEDCGAKPWPSALRTLHRYGVSPENIILYGQSIGTVPTVDLASRYECAAVILHSPLMSGLRVAFPDTRKTYCFDAFPSIDKISKVTSPVLVIHGTEDEVIDFSHGLAIYSLMDIFSPSLAWKLFRFCNCDQEVNLPKIRISPSKVAQHKMKPFLLRRVLQLLGNMGVLLEAQQSKAFSLLKKQMIKPRQTPLKPEEEQSDCKSAKSFA